MQTDLFELAAELLELPQDAVTPQLRRGATGSWDSLTHLRLMTAIEATYDTRFTMDEITQVQTLADIDAILRRSNGPGRA